MRRVAVLMGPRVLDLGVFHLTLLVTTNLASRLGRGQRQRAGVGLGCHAAARDDHRHRVRAGRLPHAGRAGRARATGTGCGARWASRCARCSALAVPAAAGLILLGPAAAGAALPARRLRCGGDGGGVRRAALVRAGAGRALLAWSWRPAPSSRRRTRSRRCCWRPARPRLNIVLGARC